MHRRTACFLTLVLGFACSGSDKAPGTGGQSGAPGGGNGGSAGSSSSMAGSAGSAAPSGGTDAGNAGTDAGGDGRGGDEGSGGDGSGGGAAGPDVTFCTQALDAAMIQLAGFRDQYTNPSSVPRAAKNGTVTQVNMGDWTSGFVGGSYWLLYEYSDDPAYLAAAEASTAAMESQKTDGSSHDLGFQFMCTFGNGYRLTQNAGYLNVLKTAAATLQTRFREPVGAIESWNAAQWDCPVIIDNMMNLHLLYTVSESGGAATFAEIATAHAQTTLTNHFRADASSFHLVNYNCGTGAVIGKQTVQGLANDSAWARGQSWGLYGYTESFVSTKTPAFLNQAQKIADYLLAHPNMPDDKVPYWDYDAPDMPSTPRDASAAAIMASALLQLSGLVPEPAKSKYRDFALDSLKSLSSTAYTAAEGQNSRFVLMHSTGHLPSNSEIDVAINYADYYYLEALLRCRALGD